MPKIDTTPPKGKKPPSELAKRYLTNPYSQEAQLIYYEVCQIRNLQICTCGHDRTCHSNYLGMGEEQRMVVDCPSVGRCGVRGCKCEGFVFSQSSSLEGKKNRKREKELSKVYPPEEK